MVGFLVEAFTTDQDRPSQMIYCLFTLLIICVSVSTNIGLIDGHTHPVWAGDRVHEFAMKVGYKFKQSHANSCTQ